MNNTIDLGFAEACLPEGTHICQIYSDGNERDETLSQFLLKGIENNEKCACFSDALSVPALAGFLAEHNHDQRGLQENGTLSLESVAEVYFKDNQFRPETMLRLLADFYHAAGTKGFKSARVIGEMSPRISSIEGGNRLLEYESRVSMLLKECPITAVCQYDSHNFDGATIMDVLRVHPMMVIDGAILNNPFFIPPEKFLKDRVL